MRTWLLIKGFLTIGVLVVLIALFWLSCLIWSGLDKALSVIQSCLNAAFADHFLD